MSNVNASISRLQPVRNQPGDKVPDRAPTAPVPARMEVPAQATGTLVPRGAMPFVKSGSAIDFEDLPLGNAEIRSASSSLVVISNAAGNLPVDWNLANSWLFILSGDVTFYAVAPAAIPAKQNGDRNREIPISVTVISSGHRFQFQGMGRPGGENIDWEDHDPAKRHTFAIGGMFGPDIPGGGFWDLYYTGFDRS